jgi:hypothetical protein
MRAIDKQAEADASSLSDTLSGAFSSQQDGLANLVAQEAVDRMNAQIKAKQGTDSASAPTDAATATDDAYVDPMTAFDQAEAGIDQLVADTDTLVSDPSSTGSIIDGLITGAQDLVVPDDSLSTGDAVTDISRLIDGTAGLLAPDSTDSTQDGGTNVMAALDDIIASFAPRPAPTVDVTA